MDLKSNLNLKLILIGIGIVIGLTACSKPEKAVVCSMHETEYEILSRFEREPCSVWIED